MILIIKYIFDTIIVSDSVKSTEVKGPVAALLTVKANWLDTLTVKQWKVMINNDVFIFSGMNEETPSLVTNGFSGKSKFNKFLLLLLLMFLSNRFKLKSEINKNVINRNINLWIKKQLNFESEYKGHKSGENPNLGLPRVHEIVWNIWKLKKFSVCLDLQT